MSTLIASITQPRSAGVAARESPIRSGPCDEPVRFWQVADMLSQMVQT